ncbi:group II truncated hemoglobin [Terrabacter sp. MAHUQ-38]|jgi:hemoglobin|uniref:group II truncated hemoglobin n=1 Tax=unclassified Terrabacter TaxID=2630222 RepID=UPI00165D6269|nr:group II truncated hemoglobin [Terrabacter sp. MAHUQ-38]MBC9823266.1 oxidoreductase [Terrabacter sp. MAHUQ-38]
MASSIYDAVGGMGGLIGLAHAWHERCMADPVVSHAFSHGFHRDHTERLAAYWAEALGGPPAYSGSIGTETGVVRMHSGNGEHREMDRRAVACFESAVDDVGLARDPDVRDALVGYFTWATGYMATYHGSRDDVPDGLTLPHWSWEGLVARTDARRGAVRPDRASGAQPQ